MAHGRTPRFPATIAAMFLFDDYSRDDTMILAESKGVDPSLHLTM